MFFRNNQEDEQSLLNNKDDDDVLKDSDTNVVNTIIEKLGMGRFSYGLILKLSTVYFIYGAEMTLLGIIAPFLKCHWNMTDLQIGFMTSTVLVGEGIGFLLWGWLGDVFGRKPILVISLVIAFLFSFFTIFASNYLWFAILRLFVGIGIASFYVPTCILSEYLPSRIRGVGILSSMISYNFGSIFIACMAKVFLLHDQWKQFIGIATGPIFLSLLVSLTLPESIRYLANHSKFDQLKRILGDIACAHKKTLDDSDFESIRPLVKRSQDKHFQALFEKERRWTTVAITVLLSSCVISYFGLIVWNTDLQQQRLDLAMQRNLNNTTSLRCHKLRAGDYTQNIIVSFSGLVGTFGSLILVDSTGRKKPISLGLLLTAVVLLSLNFKMSYLAFSTVIFLGRAFISTSLSASSVFLNELFPTSVRAKANGFAQFVAAIMAGIAPYLIQDAAHHSMILVTSLMALICVVGAIACATQRETKGQPLDPQTN